MAWKLKYKCRIIILDKQTKKIELCPADDRFSKKFNFVNALLSPRSYEKYQAPLNFLMTEM